MTGPQTQIRRPQKWRVQIKNLWFSARRSDALRTAKVWVVLAAISFGLIFGGHAMGRFGLLVGFLMALTVNSIVYFYADFRIAGLFSGHELEGQDPWGLRRQVKELARAIGVRAPAIVVIRSATPLAFSAGLIPQQARIYLSDELLKRFKNDEVRIVLAYELHRLKTQQTSSATAVSALVGLITLTASFVDDVILFRWIGDFIPKIRAKRETLLKHAGVLIGPMTLLVSPLVALLVRLSVSRKALITSDRLAGETTRAGAGTVARTLWKLDSYAKTRPFPVNLAEAHLFTVSPLTRYPMWKFASAQPPIEARLKALTGYEPL